MIFRYQRELLRAVTRPSDSLGARNSARHRRFPLHILSQSFFSLHPALVHLLQNVKRSDQKPSKSLEHPLPIFDWPSPAFCAAYTSGIDSRGLFASAHTVQQRPRAASLQPPSFFAAKSENRPQSASDCLIRRIRFVAAKRPC